MICQICGARIVDVALHERWHKAMDTILTSYVNGRVKELGK